MLVLVRLGLPPHLPELPPGLLASFGSIFPGLSDCVLELPSPPLNALWALMAFLILARPWPAQVSFRADSRHGLENERHGPKMMAAYLPTVLGHRCDSLGKAEFYWHHFSRFFPSFTLV